MEAQTIQKYIHTSPRKLRLVADMVRKLSPNQALDILGFTPKAAAKDVSSAIKTAMANAKKIGMEENKLVFKKVEVDESSKMRRFRASARGRTRPFKKRMAHIKIVLSDEGKVSQVSSVKSQESRKKTEDSKEKKGETTSL